VPSPGQDHSNRLTDEVVGDDRAIEAMFHELETGATDPQQRHELVERAIAAVVAHSVALEQVVHPAARAALPDGDEIVDRATALAADAERSMKALEGKEVTDPEFAELLGRMMAAVRLHAQTVERSILPRLALATGLDATRRTGEAFAAAKKVAPTRPHPATPHSSAARTVLGPVTGLVDRLRDTFSGRPS
jgi:hypothetical protein